MTMTGHSDTEMPLFFSSSSIRKTRLSTDVYKRQVEKKPVTAADITGDMKEMTAALDGSGGVHIWMAVSYTHLDVYKRQLLEESKYLHQRR